MRRIVLLAGLLVASCNRESLSPTGCDRLQARIAQAVSEGERCRIDSDCRVLSSNGQPPLDPWGCYAYVNAQGLAAASPLISQWQTDCTDGGSPPCPTGGTAACSDAGTCGPRQIARTGSPDSRRGPMTSAAP